MPERVLCEDGLVVTMDGGGDRTLIAVKGDETIRFWAAVQEIEAVLDGGIVQLSAFGGFCAIEVEDDEVGLEFGLDGAGRKHCSFPRRELADALAWVRTLPRPDADAPDGPPWPRTSD